MPGLGAALSSGRFPALGRRKKIVAFQQHATIFARFRLTGGTFVRSIHGCLHDDCRLKGRHYQPPPSKPGAMKTKGTVQPVVCILGTNAKTAAEIRQLVHSLAFAYRTEVFSDLPTLSSGLEPGDCMAVILDLDSLPLDNRTIRALTAAYPAVSFLCASRDHFHPDLQEAIGCHLFACLTKPIDADELDYFLKCIHAHFTKEV